MARGLFLLAAAALTLLSSSVDAADRPFVFVKATAEGGKDGKGLAWWLHDKTFRPTGKSVAGLPIAAISKEWCFANEFSPSAFVSDDRGIQAEIEATFRTAQIQFSTDTHFPVSVAQRAVTGIYEQCDGVQGAFTLVFAATGPTKVFALDELPADENPGFIAIKWNGRSLEWGHCWECTWADRLSYDADAKDFFWEIRHYLYTNSTK
jgi:hypothetical protein